MIGGKKNKSRLNAFKLKFETALPQNQNAQLLVQNYNIKRALHKLTHMINDYAFECFSMQDGENKK